MIKLKYRIQKQQIGIEDFAVGRGHITQNRGGQDITLHKVSKVLNLGLLSKVVDTKDFLNLPEDVEFIYFSGFYSEYDGAEGLYRKITSSVQQDIGIYLTTNSATFKRVIDTPVKLSWFGAVGDGLVNDLEPFLAACKYGFVILDANKTYKLSTVNTRQVECSHKFELLGNNTTILLEATNNGIPLEFVFTNLLYFSVRGIKFIGEVQEAFRLNTQNIKFIDLLGTEFIGTIEPIGIRKYVYTTTNQVITGQWKFSSPPKCSLEPSKANHPINKEFADNLKTDGVKYVRSDAYNFITAYKYYDALFAEVANVWTKKDAIEFADNLEIDDLIPKYDAFSFSYVEVVPKVGSGYLQPVNTPTPNELYPNTIWEKCKVDENEITYLESDARPLLKGRGDGGARMYFIKVALWKRIE